MRSPRVKALYSSVCAAANQIQPLSIKLSRPWALVPLTIYEGRRGETFGQGNTKSLDGCELPTVQLDVRALRLGVPRSFLARVVCYLCSAHRIRVELGPSKQRGYGWIERVAKVGEAIFGAEFRPVNHSPMDQSVAFQTAETSGETALGNTRHVSRERIEPACAMVIAYRPEHQDGPFVAQQIEKNPFLAHGAIEVFGHSVS